MTADFRRSQILIPATVFLTVGGLFAALWGVVSDQTRTEVGLRTRLTADQIASVLEKQLDVCFRITRRLQDEWESGLIPTQAIFEQRAGSVLRYFPSITAIDVLDESNVVKWSVPTGERATGLAPLNRGTVRFDLKTGTIIEDPIRVSKALTFPDGSVRIVAFLPLKSGGATTLCVLLGASTLIEESLAGSRNGNFTYLVYDDGVPIYRSPPGDDEPESVYCHSRPLAVGNRNWIVGVAPLSSPLETVLDLGTDMVLICGLLTAGSMAFVSARLLSSQRRLRENEERLATISEHIPAVVYSHETVRGTPGELLYLGPGLESIIGPRNAARVRMRFATLFDLLHPDDQKNVIAAATAGAATGETADCEARLRTDDGSYRWIRALGRPQIMDHERTRWHVLLVDITEHRRAAEALHESRERYRALVESSPVGVMIHRDMVFQFVNPAAVKLLGYERAEDLIGKEIFVVIPPGSHDVVKQRIARASPDGEPLRFRDERLVRRDGTEIDAEIIASRINFEGRNVQQTLVLDITEQRQAERRQRLLMQELDHRVKNNLASVLALFDQTAASTNDFGEFRTKFSNRVKAMARTHEILAKNGWSGADLHDIIRLSVAPHTVDEAGRVGIEGSSLVVCPRSALPIGLALHELATNALKHGSLSVPNGRVAICTTAEDECIVLRWTESGGPPAAELSAMGTGLRLVRGLVEFELGGTAVFKFDPQGLVCTLRINHAVLTGRS